MREHNADGPTQAGATRGIAAGPAGRPFAGWLVWLWVVPLVIVTWWTVNTIGTVYRVDVNQPSAVLEQSERFRDFYEFYSGARALREGTPLYEAGRLGYIYPPLLATLMLPLAGMTIETAAVVWVILKSVAGLLVAWLGAREMVLRFELGSEHGGASGVLPSRVLLGLGAVVAALGFAFLADKLRAEYRMQQSNMLLVLCWTLALVWLDCRTASGRPSWRAGLGLGLALGFAITIKYIAIIALPYLLIRRRFAQAGWVVTGTAFWMLLPAAFIGWTANADGVARAFGGIGGMLAGSGQSAGQSKVMAMNAIGCSIPSAAVHMLGATGLTASVVAVIGVVAGLVFALAWGIYKVRGQVLFVGRSGAADGSTAQGRRMVALEWVGLTVAALAFSPQTNSPHLVQLALLCLALGAAILKPVRPSLRWAAIAAAALLVAGFTLPQPSMFGRDAVVLSQRIGWPSWAMIGSFLLLLWATVGREDSGRGTGPAKPANAGTR